MNPDPETPEIRGKFYYDKERKSKFLLSDPTPGITGLAYAVLLSAVAEGCCEAWLKQIVDFYEIKVDVRMFAKTPAKLIATDPVTMKLYEPRKEPHRRHPKKRELSNFLFGFSHPNPDIKPESNPIPCQIEIEN